jgi:hypothetical protein
MSAVLSVSRTKIETPVPGTARSSQILPRACMPPKSSLTAAFRPSSPPVMSFQCCSLRLIDA